MSRPPREYRQDAHTVSLFVWMLLCAALAAVLFVHSGQIWSRQVAASEIAGGVALLIFGPLGLLVYLIRARRVWVKVDARGIVVSGDALITWDAIERIERRKPVLRGKGGPAEVRTSQFKELWDEFPAGVGCMFPEGPLIVLALGLIVVAAFLLYWLVFVAFIPLLIVPVLEVYAPLGERVNIVVRSGRPLVLRDLRDADGFLSEVLDRARVVEQ